MTAADPPELARTGSPPLVLVVPAHKVPADRIAPVVRAAMSLLRRQGPVAVVDLYADPTQLEAAERYEQLAGWRPDWLAAEVASLRVPAPRVEVQGSLDALLTGVAELARTCKSLRAEGRAVVLVGPPAVELDERFWLYAGLAGELAQHVVLCLDGHFCDLDPARSLAALLRDTPGAAARPRLAVVVPPDFVRMHRPCASVRDADMAIAMFRDETDVLEPLGHFLGVFGLPGDQDVVSPGTVRAVLDAHVGPLAEWDWKGAGSAEAGPPDARYADFLTLADRAAHLARTYGRYLTDPECAPSCASVFSQLLDCLPDEISAVLRPHGLKELARAVLDLAPVVLAIDWPARPGAVPGRWDAAMRRTTVALTEILLLAASHGVSLGDELVARAAEAGPVLELAVLRAVHEAASHGRV